MEQISQTETIPSDHSKQCWAGQATSAVQNTQCKQVYTEGLKSALPDQVSSLSAGTPVLLSTTQDIH